MVNGLVLTSKAILAQRGLHDVNWEPLVLGLLHQILNKSAQRVQHDTEMITLIALFPEAPMREWKRKVWVYVACCLELPMLKAFSALRRSYSENVDREIFIFADIQDEPDR